MEGDKTADNEKELTSTSSSDMGKLLSTNEEEKNELNDTLPTSSTDASTSIKSSHLVSEDPISSTSSEMDTTKSKISKTTGAVSNKNLETEEELLEMSMAAQPVEKIEENVDDLVSDLETLLGESIEPATPTPKAEDLDKTDETSRIGEGDEPENEVSSNTEVTDLKKVNEDVEKEKTTTEVEETAKPVGLGEGTQSSTIDDTTINVDQTVVQEEQSKQEGCKTPEETLNENISDDRRIPVGIVSEIPIHNNDGNIIKDSSKLEDIASKKSEETGDSEDIECNKDSITQEDCSEPEKKDSEKSETEEVIQKGSSEQEGGASEKSKIEDGKDIDINSDSTTKESATKPEQSCLEKSETRDGKNIQYNKESMVEIVSSKSEEIALEKCEIGPVKDIEYSQDRMILEDSSKVEKPASEKPKTVDDKDIEYNKCIITQTDQSKVEENVPKVSLNSEETEDSMTQEKSTELEQTLPEKSLEAEDCKDIDCDKNSMNLPKLEEVAFETTAETVASGIEDSKQISSEEIPKEECSKEELLNKSEEIREVALDVPTENIESMQTEENSMEIAENNGDEKQNEAPTDVTMEHHSVEVLEKLDEEITQSVDVDQSSTESTGQTVEEKGESLEVEKDSQDSTDQNEEISHQIQEKNVDSEITLQEKAAVIKESEVSKDTHELNSCITKDSSEVLEKKTEDIENLSVNDQKDEDLARENIKMEEEAETNITKASSSNLQERGQLEEQEEKDGPGTSECPDEPESQNGQPMEEIETDDKTENITVDTPQEGSKDEKSASSETKHSLEISETISQIEAEKDLRSVTESSKELEEGPKIESTQEQTSDHLEISTQAGPFKDDLQESPMAEEADGKLQESPKAEEVKEKFQESSLAGEADEKLQESAVAQEADEKPSENAPEEIEISELPDSSEPVEEAEIVELEPVVEEPDEECQSSATAVNDQTEETIITEVKEEDKLPAIAEDIEDAADENMGAPSEIKADEESDKSSGKDQEVEDLLQDNNITEKVEYQEKITDSNAEQPIDECQERNMEQNEYEKCPENEPINDEAQDIQKDQICSKINELEATVEVISNDGGEKSSQKENLSEISKESSDEGCTIPDSDRNTQSEIVYASKADDTEDTDCYSKEALVQTKDSDKEQQTCESKSEVDQDELENKTTHSQDISELPVSEDVSDNTEDEIKLEIAIEKPDEELPVQDTEIKVGEEKLEEIINEVQDSGIKEEEKIEEKVVESIQDLKPTPEINIRRKTVEQDLEKVVCLSEESSDSDTNEEAIKSLQKTVENKELDGEMDTLIHNVPLTDELPSNSVENDLIKIAREVEQLQNAESNDPIESDESMPGIEDILSDQQQQILNEVPVDTAENLETILAVASLQNEPVPEVKVERRLSEKELREMEAIRMAVASITDSSQDTYDSYLVESSMTIENSIPEVSSDVQELSSDTQELTCDVQELSDETQNRAEALVDNSSIRLEQTEITQETGIVVEDIAEKETENKTEAEEIVTEQKTVSFSKDADKSNSDEIDDPNSATKSDICTSQTVNSESENIQDNITIENIIAKTSEPEQEKDKETTVVTSGKEEDSVVSSDEIKENDTTVTSEKFKDNDTVVTSGEIKEMDTGMTSQEIIMNDTVVTSKEIKENDTAVTSEEIKEKDTVVTCEEIKENDTAVTSEEIKEKDTVVTSEEIKVNDTAVTSEENKENDTVVTSEKIKVNDTVVNSEEIKENDTIVTSEEIKENDTAVISEEIKENDRVVTSEEIKEIEKAVSSEEIKRKDTVVTSEEIKENDTAVSSEEIKQKNAVVTSEEIKENDTAVSSEEIKEKEVLKSAPEHACLSPKKDKIKEQLIDNIETENKVLVPEAIEEKELSSDHPVLEKRKASDSKEVVKEKRGHEEKRFKASAPEEKKSEHLVEEDALSSAKLTKERKVILSDQPKEENMAVPQVAEERSLRNRARRGNKVIEPLSISVEEIEKKEKPYSPKVTIKPVKVPDEEVSTTSDAEGNKGSLKITITKQSDKMHSILKVYDPADEPDQTPAQGEPIPKLIIKPKMQQVEQQLSPKMSTRSTKVYSPTSTQRCSSPRVTIKPVVKPSESKNEALSPLKITFKPVVRPDEGNKRHSPKTSKEQDQKNPNPKITIKPIPKPAETEKEETSISTPKVTIKPLKRPLEDTELENEQEKSSPKITIKPVIKPADQEVDHSNQTTPKLKIKPIRKHEDEENNISEKDRDSPKISIKPVVKPAEVDDEEEVKERIVLKINKGNLPTPSKDSRKREYPDDEKTEKMGKLKLKFSTMGGQTHIVQEGDEGNKRQRKDSGYSGKKDEELSNKRALEEKIPDKNKRLRSSITPDKGHEDSSDGIKIHDQKIDSPIVISEDSRSQHSTDCVENTPDISKISDIASRTTHIEATPIVTVGVVTPSVSPAPKKRGRPRKVPLEVREELKDPPTTPQVTPQTTPQSTPVADVSSVSTDKSEPGTPTATPSPLGRPKRSCRGQNVIATLGIKPRKPRGGGKGRGSKVNMGDREPVVVTTPVEPLQTVSMKPEKEQKLTKAKLKLIQKAAEDEVNKAKDEQEAKEQAEAKTGEALRLQGEEKALKEQAEALSQKPESVEQKLVDNSKEKLQEDGPKDTKQKDEESASEQNVPKQEETELINQKELDEKQKDIEAQKLCESEDAAKGEETLKRKKEQEEQTPIKKKKEDKTPPRKLEVTTRRQKAQLQKAAEGVDKVSVEPEKSPAEIKKSDGNPKKETASEANPSVESSTGVNSAAHKDSVETKESESKVEEEKVKEQVKKTPEPKRKAKITPEKPKKVVEDSKSEEAIVSEENLKAAPEKKAEEAIEPIAEKNVPDQIKVEKEKIVEDITVKEKEVVKEDKIPQESLTENKKPEEASAETEDKKPEEASAEDDEESEDSEIERRRELIKLKKQEAIKKCRAKRMEKLAKVAELKRKRQETVAQQRAAKLAAEEAEKQAAEKSKINRRYGRYGTPKPQISLIDEPVREVEGTIKSHIGLFSPHKEHLMISHPMAMDDDSDQQLRPTDVSLTSMSSSKLVDSTDETPSKHRRTMGSEDLMMVDEETRMSADFRGSRAQTPAKQGIPPDAMIEDSQGSLGGESGGGKSKSSRAPKMEVFQDLESALVTAEQLAEYSWNGRGQFMIQEQVTQFLGIKSFKRKYPNCQRRPVDMQERDYLKENGFVTEAQCDLGLTAVNAQDILDIMYNDFQDKYEEYCKVQREKQARELANKQKALSQFSLKPGYEKLDIIEQAVQSAAAWNQQFNKKRKEERKAHMDLQNLTVHYPKSKVKIIPTPKIGDHPIALVPGQYTDYYKDFTPTELNNLPLNTMCYSEIKVPGLESDSDDSSSGSESESESSSNSSSSDGSCDEDCKECCKPDGADERGVALNDVSMDNNGSNDSVVLVGVSTPATITA